MVRWGMVIDLDRCTACQACTVACQTENNSPYATAQENAKGVTMAWTEVLTESSGKYPEPHQKFLTRPCQQCRRAPCVRVCPVAATYKSDDGITMQDYERCIGCRSCMIACPYSVRVFNWFDGSKRWPGTLANARNPLGQPTRPKGVVEKCIFCYHRINRLRRDLWEGTAPAFVLEEVRGRYRPGDEPSPEVVGHAVDVLARYFYGNEATPENFDPKAAFYLPACVQVCPPSARVFGDLANPKNLVADLARSRRAFELLEELGTHPNVIYLKEQD